MTDPEYNNLPMGPTPETAEAAADPDHLRHPGLRGDYAGTCLICTRPTDTGFGMPKRHADLAGLLVAAWDEDPRLARAIARQGDSDPRNAGRNRLIRCCEACAARARARGVTWVRVALMVPGAPIPAVPWPIPRDPSEIDWG